MRRPRPGARGITAIVVAAALAGGGVWLASTGGGTAESSPPTPIGVVPTGTPTAGANRLTIDLRRVEGTHVSGSRVRPRRLRSAAEAIRRVMTDLYTTGFVDPARWDGGRFPTIEDLFTLRTRARVHRDLGELTLGSLAPHLDAVRPGRTTLGVRFLVGTRPAVAVASVRFEGTAIAQGAELPIEHDGIYTLRRSERSWRIASYKVRSHLPSIDEVDRKARKAAGSPGVASTGTFFLLVIGSDARPGQSPEGTRGDSLHIVGINPAKHAVSILGIPRDSFVPIPGVGMRKINEALFWGGPKLVVRTVEQLTGVAIDAFVLTGFKGFQDLVNAVGGVGVDVPYRMSDPYSHARFAPGMRHMNGRAALAFSRDRHDVPGGDFGRSVNQGRMLIAALRQLKADVAKNPGSILNWIAAGARILRSDLSLSDMAELLLSMPSLDPGKVENRVVSGTGATIGGLSVVLLGSAAHAMFRDLAADAIFNDRP
jgi:polyisoprenyl-teichoic acid--peptidoglycan teichoic acid transferase